MKFGLIRCALGRHEVDNGDVKKVYGRETGRCRNCHQVLEQEAPGHWIVPPLHDAGLG